MGNARLWSLLWNLMTVKTNTGRVKDALLTVRRETKSRSHRKSKRGSKGRWLATCCL